MSASLAARQPRGLLRGLGEDRRSSAPVKGKTQKPSMSIELEREPWKTTPSLRELTFRVMFPEGEVADCIDANVVCSNDTAMEERGLCCEGTASTNTGLFQDILVVKLCQGSFHNNVQERLEISAGRTNTGGCHANRNSVHNVLLDVTIQLNKKVSRYTCGALVQLGIRWSCHREIVPRWHALQTSRWCR